MGFSGRIFLLDEDDGLYSLPNTRFAQMLRNPLNHPLPRFAGARVRMAEAIVEFENRRTIRVVRTSFAVLAFDLQGCFDLRAFDRHQRAHAELALALTAEPARAATVIDATSRFVSQGGRWVPSPAVARLIDEAALGRVKCPRLM